jgi:hypothetical protein
MSRPIYTAVAAVSGGRQHAHGELDVQLRASTERGNIGVTLAANGETVD